FVEYRNAVRICVGLARRDHSALSRAQSASRIPRPRRNRRARIERILLRAADVGPADSHLAALLWMAADRAGNLSVLQHEAQRVRDQLRFDRLRSEQPFTKWASCTF